MRVYGELLHYGFSDVSGSSGHDYPMVRYNVCCYIDSLDVLDTS